MWNDVNSVYKEVLHQFTRSATHESQFVKFCDGKMAAYYLRQHYNLKPGLNSAVRAGLNKDCSFKSDKPVPKTVPSPSSDKSNRKIYKEEEQTPHRGCIRYIHQPYLFITAWWR